MRPRAECALGKSAILQDLMARRSTQRLTTTMLMVFSLLFSQWALASYVCSPGATAQTEHAGLAMEMADGQPCPGMAAGQIDTEQPVLCYQHCAGAPQSFDPVHLPALSLPAVLLVLLVPALRDASSTQASTAEDAAQARRRSDPLFLSTLRLRV